MSPFLFLLALSAAAPSGHSERPWPGVSWKQSAGQVETALGKIVRHHTPDAAERKRVAEAESLIGPSASTEKLEIPEITLYGHRWRVSFCFARDGDELVLVNFEPLDEPNKAALFLAVKNALVVAYGDPLHERLSGRGGSVAWSAPPSVILLDFFEGVDSFRFFRVEPAFAKDLLDPILWSK